MRLSNSALDKYETCPRLYKYHYIDKIRYNRNKSHLLLGTAIDNACELYLENSSKCAALELYSKIMDDLILNYEDYDYLRKDKDVGFCDEKDIDEKLFTAKSVLNKGRHLLESRLFDFIDENVLETYATQCELYIDDSEGNTIIGKPDFIIKDKDGDVVLVDLKTSGSSYSRRKLTESQQLHLYYLMSKIRPIEGIPKIDKIAYLVLRKDKNSKGELFDIQYLKCEPIDSVIEDVMERFNIAIENISNNVFNKTKTKRHCTMQFGAKCIYFDLCHGNKTVDEIETLTIKEVKK